MKPKKPKKKRTPEILFPGSGFMTSPKTHERERKNRREDGERESRQKQHKTASEKHFFDISFSMYPCDCRLRIMTDSSFAICQKCLLSYSARVRQVKTKI